jgi:hypothetical protein
MSSKRFSVAPLTAPTAGEPIPEAPVKIPPAKAARPRKAAQTAPERSNAVSPVRSTPAPAEAPQRRQSGPPRPSRLTVDLPPDEHRGLRAWCNDAAGELDVSSIAQADVVRVLLKELRRDTALAERVLDVLAEQRARG